MCYVIIWHFTGKLSWFDLINLTGGWCPINNLFFFFLTLIYFLKLFIYFLFLEIFILILIFNYTVIVVMGNYSV